MSVAADIRAAVKAVIDGLSLAGNPGIVVRKQPLYRSGDPAAGVVVVSGVELGAETFLAEDDSAIAGRYGIAVTCIRPNAAAVVSAGTVEDWVQTIRRALYKPNPLPAVSAVSNVELRDRQWFNPAGLDKNYDFAQLSLHYETIESRS